MANSPSSGPAALAPRRPLADAVAPRILVRWSSALWPLGFTIVLLLAAGLRLFALDLVEFKADEAGATLLARELTSTGVWPGIGLLSSAAAYNPPGFVYLLALPVWLNPDPLFATAAIALANVAALGLALGLTWRYFGRAAALIATALYAVSPWAILYSRKIWAQDLLPLFVVLGFVALFAAVVRGRARGLFWAPLWLAVAVQLHPSAAPYGFLVLAAPFLTAARHRWRWWLAGVLVAGLSFLPYLIYNATHEFREIARFLEVTGGPARLDLAAPALALQNIAGAGADSLAEIKLDAFAPAWTRWLSLAESALFLVAYLALAALWLRGWRRPVWRTAHKPTWRALGLLLAWFSVPVLFSLRHATALHPHYFIALYPAAFLIIGVAVATWLGWGPLSKGAERPAPLAPAGPPPPAPAPVATGAGYPPGGGGRAFQRWGVRAAALALLTLLAVGQLTIWGGFQGYVAAGRDLGRYGVPLGAWQRVVAEADALRPAAGPARLYLYARDDAAAALTYLAGARFNVIVVSGGSRPERVLPADPGAVWIVPIQTREGEALAALARHESDASARVIVMGEGTPVAWVGRVPDRAQAASTPPQPLRTEQP